MSTADDYQDEDILGRLTLGPNHRLKSRTRHTIGATVVTDDDGSRPRLTGGIELPRAAFILLMRLKDSSDVYALHFDAEGNEMTDTCHDSLPYALKHVKFEYDAELPDWEKLMPDEWVGITEIPA